MLSTSALAVAQSNTIPGRDLRLDDTWSLDAVNAFGNSAHFGTFPNGVSPFGAWTRVCNPGTSPIPFTAAMSPNHAFIHYLIARESSGRFVQISDWSYVKHTFGSSNDPSVCGSCAGPGNFNFVEVGCSDTYANYQACDHFNLGPPQEVDPWLGAWVPTGSLFDRGDPDVGFPQNQDTIRSLTQTQANVLNSTMHHQVRVYDADLNVTGATFWWQAGYLIPGEADALRSDNIASRQFFPSWTGSHWATSDGTNLLSGSILQRWSGASLSSNSNGNDDGRFYVAVKVTGPTNGTYHYEYAVHNRDNKRGLGALHIPVCPAATVSNFGFHDVDQDPSNSWSGSLAGSEIVFSTVNNPLRWNSLFNFWFDCDAAPVTGSPLTLTQFDLGAGALTVAVTSTAPLGLYNQNLGPGCGSPAPTLFGTGSPDHGTIGNASFGLRSTGNPAGATCGFVVSFADGSTLLGPGCTLYSASTASVGSLLIVAADGSGAAAMPLAVPNVPALEGIHLDFQMANIHAGGAYLGTFNLSNGLRARIGSAISTCP
ncbi:MAG TPA: hypothetical protein VK348_03605 [Planctomycetota bacterium]|nr:hypothetical protein [Planctomycetota bacterium]